VIGLGPSVTSLRAYVYSSAPGVAEPRRIQSACHSPSSSPVSKRAGAANGPAWPAASQVRTVHA